MEPCIVGEKKGVSIWRVFVEVRVKKRPSGLRVLFHHRSRADRRILYRASAGSEADGSAELARLGPLALPGRSNA